ncbi:MAG: hypothetical protein D6715_03460 [Calditrichaeota bacterium]|nr:MAG: hypothetical protein D6715_03460 [Calditrichota bacterium]
MKVCIALLADLEPFESFARMANALEVAKECQQNGDEVAIVFDGAGVKWPAALEDPEHKYHALYQSVKQSIAGVCKYCAAAFGVKNQIETLGLPLVGEFDDHPSLRKYLAEGYHVLTF